MARTRPILPLVVAGSMILVVAAVAWYPHPAMLIVVRAQRAVYAPGEPVNFSITLMVGGNRDVLVPVLSRAPGCGVWYAVEDEKNGTIYPDVQGALYCPSNYARALHPGDFLSWNFTWTQVNGSGASVPANRWYQLRPTLQTSPDVEVVTGAVRIFVEST